MSLFKYIEDEEFESESLEMDLNDYISGNSNIYNNIQIISKFIQIIEILEDYMNINYHCHIYIQL